MVEPVDLYSKRPVWPQSQPPFVKVFGPNDSPWNPVIEIVPKRKRVNVMTDLKLGVKCCWIVTTAIFILWMIVWHYAGR